MPIYQTKRVLVVGAGGALAQAFRLQAPSEIEFHGVEYSSISRMDGYNSWINADARDFSTMKAALFESEADLIISFAGVFGAVSFDTLMSINVGIARNILEAILLVPQKQRSRLLLIGSAAEYGVPRSNPVAEDHPTAPISDYGLSKLFQTELMLSYWRRFGLDVLVARLFNVDGPGLSMELAPGRWRKLVAELSDGAFLDVGNLEAFRDYLPINSAAKDIWKVALLGDSGNVYNVCSGVPLAMAALLSAIIAESGKCIKPRKSENLYRTNDVPVIYGDRSRLDALEA